MEHKCLHEKEIILLIDHSQDMGRDIKKVLKLLMGNGAAGIITTQKLHEQSLKRLWALVKYAGGGLAGVTTLAAILVKVYGA